MQPKPSSLHRPSHSYATANVSLWLHQLLLSCLSRRSKTLPSSPLYTPPATTALVSHYRTDQIQSCMHVLSCHKWLWSFLPLKCFMSTVRPVRFAPFLILAHSGSKNTNARRMSFSVVPAWTLHFKLPPS